MLLVLLAWLLCWVVADAASPRTGAAAVRNSVGVMVVTVPSVPPQVEDALP